MSGNVLPIIANILEKTAFGANNSEIAELIEQVRDVSPSASATQTLHGCVFT